jgi:sugar O-acyltransferase (sialic acid O-acetyltransferase NeuD family)
MDTILIGAGGHGKVVLDILQCQGKHRVIGFLDADPSLHGTTVAGVPVIGGINQLVKLKAQKVRAAVIAIGDNRVRRQYAHEAADAGLELINAIHPAATIARSVTLGRNVVVAAGAVVCTEAQLGDSVIVNTSAIVDHECVVGEAVHIAPGAVLAGRVRVEPLAFIGMGAKVIQCLTIGAETVVGAGAVVRTDLPPRVTAVGVPARVIKRAS